MAVENEYGNIVTTPAANTVLADTGQMAAGRYRFKVRGGASDTVAVGKGIAIEHRNAGNTANVSSFMIPVLAFSDTEWIRDIAANERMRAIVLVAGASGSRYGAMITTVQLG
jgi:hypothetical protein